MYSISRGLAHSLWVLRARDCSESTAPEEVATAAAALRVDVVEEVFEVELDLTDAIVVDVEDSLVDVLLAGALVTVTVTVTVLAPVAVVCRRTMAISEADAREANVDAKKSSGAERSIIKSELR